VRLDAALWGTSGFRGINRIKQFLLKFFNYLDLFFSIIGMKRAKFVLVNSKFSKELIKWGKVRIIFPPLDSEKFRPDLSKKENDLIIYVSRFAPEKKQDLALRLFKQISKEGVYNLCLIGHPSFGGFYKNLKEASSKISGSNVVADIPEPGLIDYYQRATILWFLRKGEPFGLVPVEGMACGTIPIAIRGGGVSETIVDNESGFLCETYRELISKTKILLSDPDLRQKLMQGAIKRAKIFRKEIFINKCEKAVKHALYHSDDFK
jgi:glycosyltransferase involved in cell wall biosynthesis